MISSTSPLDVPGVPSRLRPGELVEILRSERERAGNRIAERLAPRRPRPAKPPARKK